MAVQRLVDDGKRLPPQQVIMVVNERLFKRGAVVAVAVSGGMDSMALLHWCAANCERLGFVTKAVNLDHGLRGKTSERDSLFVAQYCRNNNIELFFRRVNAVADFGGGGSIEAAAKRARYTFFEDILKDNGADYIATAHHSDDCAETVIYNLLRGSGLRGARGIAPQSGRILRPLLTTDRASIEQYCKDNGIPHVEDESNSDTAFCRNYIRHNIMPVIQERFPRGADNLAAFAARAASDEECLELMRPEPVLKSDSAYIPSRYFRLHRSLLSRTVLRALSLLGADRDITTKNIDAVIALNTAPQGTRLDIKSGISAISDGGGGVTLTLAPPASAAPPQSPYLLPFREGTTTTPDGLLTVRRENAIPSADEMTANSGEGARERTLYIDAAKVPDGCVFRRRQDGDRIALLGGGTTPLKKLFQSRGIPPELRAKLPVIAAPDGEVVAVAGVEISGKLKLSDTTQSVYIITYTEDNNGKNN